MKPQSKWMITSIAAVALASGLASAQTTPPRYSVLDLGLVGASGAPWSIANNGLIAGVVVTSDNKSHVAVWFQGFEFVMGTSALGGPNSEANGISLNGQVVGATQTKAANGEDFCGFTAMGLAPSSTACRPFILQDGVMNTLPTLGGANGVANAVNSQGLAAGWAETQSPDPNGACTVSQFEPVIWTKTGVTQLNTFPGDTDGVAWSINESGQAVGASGTCTGFSVNSGDYLLEKHPMLWTDGAAINLGTLGGTGALSGNHACSINNRGQVAGHSDLAGDTTFHGFLWSWETGIKDIGTLPGDFASLAIGIGDQGTAVGASFDQNFNERAILIADGTLTDLNTLVSSNPQQLYLLQGNSINVSGQIVGLAATSNGDIHGFLAIPSSDLSNSTALEDVTMPVLSSNVRKAIQRRLGIHGI
jgi:probable HAF family extracellular repeat protein